MVRVCASALGEKTNVMSDNVSILLKCANGSQGTIHYFANGSKSWPKESIEVYSQGRVFNIDNFKTLTCEGVPGVKVVKLKAQDKGHRNQFKAYVNFLAGNTSIPIPFDQILATTNTSFAVLDSLRLGEWVTVE